MKITKRQLQRIIIEERRKLRNEGITRGKMNEVLDPDDPEYEDAVDNLFNDFRNLIAVAKDAGLLQEDIDDAYRNAVLYIRTMT